MRQHCVIVQHFDKETMKPGKKITFIHTNFIQDVNKLMYKKTIILKDILKRELRG